MASAFLELKFSFRSYSPGCNSRRELIQPPSSYQEFWHGKSLLPGNWKILHLCMSDWKNSKSTPLFFRNFQKCYEGVGSNIKVPFEITIGARTRFIVFPTPEKSELFWLFAPILKKNSGHTCYNMRSYVCPCVLFSVRKLSYLCTVKFGNKSH